MHPVNKHIFKKNELVFIDRNNEYHGGQMAIFRGCTIKWASVSIIEPLNIKTFMVKINEITPLNYYLTDTWGGIDNVLF